MAHRHLTRTAVFVMIERDEKYLMLRRSNTGWADGLLTFPTGHVDQGDMVTDACVTEAAEEVCIQVNKTALALAHVAYIRDIYVQFFFRAPVWSGEPSLGEPALSSELLWVDKHDLRDDIIPLVLQVIKYSNQGIVFSEHEDMP